MRSHCLRVNILENLTRKRSAEFLSRESLIWKRRNGSRRNFKFLVFSTFLLAEEIRHNFKHKFTLSNFGTQH